ncbi:MAG: AbrB/MazE/SpoVT family DNA-binding domain-containing protein [Candidatus Roizmanbacteria bacterium]|nr:AbrB/MazE/SpoVT family DNA-binding domain-containing protein [Candidatus Roizmanbacteria bacterium]
MQQTVYKSGSSLVVVVPSEFVEVIGVKTGDMVDVNINYDKGIIRYTFSGTKQLTISGVSLKRK